MTNLKFGQKPAFPGRDRPNLTEFWKSFILTPRLREVSMGERTKWLATAALATGLDAVTATYYGGVVWKAFSVVIWSKLLLLLLAAVWAITPLHVWVYACSHLRQATKERRVVVSNPVNDLSADMAEEIDV
jgi:hypothetical protein